MTQEFSECLNKYTKEHHESSGKAETPEQYQVSNNENCQFNQGQLQISVGVLDLT